MHVRSLGRTGLDYFLTGGFSTAFSSGISRRRGLPTKGTVHIVPTIGFTGGGGISKRLETNFGWILNPFCGVAYSRSWARINVEDLREETGRTRTYSGFGGAVGLEIELSPAISVSGAFRVSLDDFDRSFGIGLNLH